ncbi:putative transcriptional regulator/DNA-binding XRE family transcriptional regulator [Allobranchiibius huperziae]|uniref:Putative transcriptional regulator/DNA-binding XRE family transcriptional regulator n=2 Tax=Allobranchiibius huperziae TaxID=1874116 RepID=A0A853DGY6_9MICO|nr:helix-turn-helix domain-containing protein [Allobranchiibius huperziae]NYJ74111.1 putative transcriptional regulator/DNA-binding XRE family transcriptional regulator [Allobranchiibius huperziae]
MPGLDRRNAPRTGVKKRNSVQMTTTGPIPPEVDGVPDAPTGRLTSPHPAPSTSVGGGDVPDPLTVGRRVRHVRQESGRTLGDVAAEIGMSASALSLIENGKREPRLSVLNALAQALGTQLSELLTTAPPSRRAALEIRLERAQRGEGYDALGLPRVKIGPRLPTEALEALVGLHEAMAASSAERAATPEHARRANLGLRERMRAADNYFGEIEDEAAQLLGAINYTGGPVGRVSVDRMAAHLGFSLVHTGDLPGSTRTVTDLQHKRIYLPQPEAGQHDSRSLALQALGHLVLGHDVPVDYAEFLTQRVEINYFAASVLMPQEGAVQLLRQAMDAKDIAIEDLRDAFAVSYETAAHRFTNLATRHLGIPVHFMRIGQDGVIYKAYENDGVIFPSDATGAIEGQRVCRAWTARRVFEQPDLSQAFCAYTDTRSGTYWCTAAIDRTPAGVFSVNVGVRYQDVKWMRGRETTHRATSRCPDPTCCNLPPADLADRWSGNAWPSARAHSHLLAAMPPGVFPGVDDTEVYRFLDRHAPA